MKKDSKPKTTALVVRKKQQQKPTVLIAKTKQQKTARPTTHEEQVERFREFAGNVGAFVSALLAMPDPEERYNTMARKKRPARERPINLEDLEQKYIEQLPMMAALLIPDAGYDAGEVAREAIELMDAILDELSEE